MKRIERVIIIMTLLCSLLIPGTSFAENNNVADCFEEDANCAEIQGTDYSNDKSINSSTIEQEEQETAITVNEQQGGPSLFRNFIQMIFALLLVLGLIYVMLKLVNRRQQLFSQTQTLENLGGISVGQNKSIQVIRVGSKMYLVGVGDNVQLLKEIDDEITKKNLTQKQVEESMTLRQWIKSFLPATKNKQAHDQENSFKHIFANELEQMKDKRQQMINQLDKKDDTHE